MQELKILLRGLYIILCLLSTSLLLFIAREVPHRDPNNKTNNWELLSLAIYCYPNLGFKIGSLLYYILVAISNRDDLYSRSANKIFVLIALLFAIFDATIAVYIFKVVG